MKMDWTEQKGIISAIILGLAMLLYFLYQKLSKSPIKVPEGALAVGKVKNLFIYPVKSTRPLIDIEEAKATKMCLTTNDNDDIRDRTWMVISETGVFVSQRAEPRLSLLQPSVPFEGDMLHLDGPGMPTLKVSKYLSKRTSKVRNVSVFGHHLDAVHCGQEAADWISKYLDKPGFSLAYLSPDLPGRKVNEFDTPTHKLFLDQDRVAFPDVAPVMMMSENTVNDVKSRVPDKDITVMNFRPNILIEGCEAFDEDTWDEIYIGQTKMTGVTGCDRCLMTTVNHKDGTKYKDREPLNTLKSYRLKDGTDPILGLFANVLTEGMLKVGDTVYVTRKSVKSVPQT